MTRKGMQRKQCPPTCPHLHTAPCFLQQNRARLSRSKPCEEEGAAAGSSSLCPLLPDHPPSHSFPLSSLPARPHPSPQCICLLPPVMAALLLENRPLKVLKEGREIKLLAGEEEAKEEEEDEEVAAAAARVWKLFLAPGLSDRFSHCVGEKRMGGVGMRPALQKRYATLSLGWAPTDSQYLILSTRSLTSLVPSKL